MPALAPPAAKRRLSQASFSSRGAEKLCLVFQSAGMCVHKISGSVEMWGGTRSSLLQSQIFYVYRPRPPAFRYVPIVRGSGVSEQGVPLFAGLSCAPAIDASSLSLAIDSGFVRLALCADTHAIASSEEI